jgi:16S rRNA (cytosine967-C5)-methyltransferase
VPGSPDPALAARALAMRVLLEVGRGPAHADVALAAALAAADLSPRDRAFATRLVYGTLAWQGRLDWQLARLTTRETAGLDPAVRVALRLGLHQLTLLDRIPDHAAVATSVELVKHEVPAASGFVNAVLRRAVRERDALPLPDPASDPTEHLAVALSHPTWLVARWRAELGPAVADLLAADNEAAPTVLRARPGGRDALVARLAAAGIAGAPARFAPDAVRVEAIDPHALAEFTAGAMSVQSEASQLVGHLLAPAPGMRVLDACAAPGGKSAHAAELMEDRGLVVALAHRRRGARAVARNATRLGLRSIAPVVADARSAAAALGGGFDRVLVDAPCSGFGTLRAHPEVRWRRTPEDVARLAADQRTILEAVTPLVKPGGALVYATCTILAEENEEVVRPWLDAHPELEREDASSFLPPAAGVLVNDVGALRTLPHRDGLDGFFAVRVRRRG